MTKLATALATACAALVLATAALGGATGYAGPMQFYAGSTGASSYSSSWWRNTFNKQSGGYDSTVTFIDNVSYGWHNTVRNTSLVTYTTWYSSQVKKGHCRANVAVYGGCWIFN